MAFYLHREFVSEPKLLVLNDLRLVDPNQPEHDGRPGACQIDHLILHRWGAFVIESKSVTDQVAVRDDGAGGDEWTRRYAGREQGFPSPIQQARRQGEFLRAFLQNQRQELLGRMPTGLRTISKIARGSDLRGFRQMPIQIIVAISDHGKILRKNQWIPPSSPFQTYVIKADHVGSKVREEFQKHSAGASLVRKPVGEYGLWSMKAEEAERTAKFLAESHQARAHGSVQSEDKPGSVPRPRSSTLKSRPKPEPEPLTPDPEPRIEAPATPGLPSRPACKSCHGTSLAARWGRYGYYWNCSSCGANTAMPTVCSACGAAGRRGQTVRIRKDGTNYHRACESCGIEERIWIDS